MTWRNHLENFPMGMFIGICIGISFSWWLGADISEEAKKYGTFILTALVTLIGSGIALATAIWNTESRRERKLLVARAELPITLSNMRRRAFYGFNEIAKVDSIVDQAPQVGVMPYRKDRERVRTCLGEVALSDDDKRVLQSCIEGADGNALDWLILLVAHWQLTVLNMEDHLRPNQHPNERNSFRIAVDWEILNAILVELDEFARTGKQPREELPQLNRDHAYIAGEVPQVGGEKWHKVRLESLNCYDKRGGLTIKGFRKRLSSSD